VDENLYHRVTTSYQAFFEVQQLVGNPEFYPQYEGFFQDNLE